MAQIQRTRLDRFLRHARKKARLTVAALHPSKIGGRFRLSPVLSNSLPKAGTHLLEGILEELPGLRNAGLRTIVEHRERDPHRLRMGAFYNAHLPWTMVRQEWLQAAGVNVLFLIRDPRDMVLSRMHYVRDIDHTHPAHHCLRSAATEEEAIALSVRGAPGMPCLREELISFSGWLRAADVTIRYEDLLGSERGGDDAVRVGAIVRLATACGIHLTQDSAVAVSARAAVKRTSTLRRGRSGSWQEHTALLERLFADEGVDEIMGLYGYQW